MTVAGHVAVYALDGPDGEIRYVGKSIDPEQRLLAHIAGARRSKTHKGRWIAKILDTGHRPGLWVLGWHLPGEDVDANERNWIKHLRQDHGYKLTNATEGGDGRTNWSDTDKLEHGRIIRRSMTAEVRARMRTARRRTVELQRASGWKPKPITEETRLKLSMSHVGKRQSQETIAKRLATIAERKAKQ